MTMWVLVVKFVFIILLTGSGRSKDTTCAPRWFDCGNGKCISEIWQCDGENDCGNSNDEKDCEIPRIVNPCLSSQFHCNTTDLCIPEKWYCDGENDCDDGFDEMECTESCIGGFVCRDHHCIPERWRCDGNVDCTDGSDEELCPQGKLCNDSEFLCSSGSCILQSLVCNGKKDCVDGSDEGPHCGDPCENANCSQNCKSTPTGPHCYCNDGYAFDSKDNKTCHDIDECQQEGFCSHECTNTAGSYKCSCHEGYELFNRTCRATGADPLLIYSTLKEVRGIHVRANQFFHIVGKLSHVSAVDVDPKSQRVYWIDVSNKTAIYSTKLDGRDLRSVLSHGLLVPEDIAVDYITNNIYITDSGLQQVLACKSDGRMCHVLHANVEKPRSIALDPDNGLMYWSDWGKHSSGIYRSGMDGSRRISMVSNRIGWPNGIALDHTTNRLYWADAKLNTIEFITLDGSQRTVLLNTTVFHPYSLAVFEDTLYWSDWTTFSLESCNKFTGHKVTILARRRERIMGVHVYHPVLISKVSNPCWSNDCSHMCLMSPVKGFRCACPYSFTLMTDEKTCIKEQGESVFVSEGSSVFYISPKMVGSEAIAELPLSVGEAMISRVAYDSKSRYIFVADLMKPAIYAINMTSLHMQTLVANYITMPEDLAFDWKSNNLYWIDSAKGTAEVININLLKRVVIVRDLRHPVALAISPAQGLMFIATIGSPDLSMYDMDGKKRKILYSVPGFPMSLALHPSKSILYWADPMTETISYVNYSSNREAQIMKTKLTGVMSVSASEEYIYWTGKKRGLNLMTGDVTRVLQLPGQKNAAVSRKVTYSPGVTTAGLSMCLIGNGGCSYVCLTSPAGRTCACASEKILSADNVTCLARECDDEDFRCVNGQCLSAEKRCDGTKDCADGSDEVGCSNRCSADDFQCKSGRCILKSWRCDSRNDCDDNSDEEDCPPTTNCSKDQMTCLNGACVPMIWRCDGDTDCPDASDEKNCNATRCLSNSEARCDNGQCVPISWICDGDTNCFDGSDERNCSKPKGCTFQQFQCESDGVCIDQILRCDRRDDCVDGSDEKHCLNVKADCSRGMFLCKDGGCINDFEVCDGHSDCKDNEDEMNCTHLVCQAEEILCSNKRCILRQWICDGDEDCSDGSDEENCVEAKTRVPTLPPVPDCDGFYCYVSNQCLPWSKVCDGNQDCEDLPDEGGSCSRACAHRNDGCSHVCQKTPFGSKCFCNQGYSLLPDNKTCDDVNECLESSTCSHFCNNTRGSFKCSCAEGYALRNDHRFCKAEGGSATLMYLLGKQVRGIDLNSHSQRVYINIEDADMKGMDYDAAEGVFYWTEENDGSINSFSASTHSREVIYKSPSIPRIVKYDWIAQNLYYLDKSSSIGVCTKDGRICETLIQSSIAILDSMTIAPTFGLMFWTVWANSLNKQFSGLVERAEMDGSHRMPIVSDKLIAPTAITVDHVLEMIYWSDREMSVLECADFRGFKRRRVVKSEAYHPQAIAVFEDYLYWADWGTDSIIRCHKYIEGKCDKIHENNVKAHILLVAHKVMQPKALNKCLPMSCQHLCVLTSQDPVCICDDGLKENITCTKSSVEIDAASPSTPPSKSSVESDAASRSTPPSSLSTSILATPSAAELQCTEAYCNGDGTCTVVNGTFICNCSYPYSGEKCEVSVAASVSKSDQRWIIAVILAVIVTGIMVLLIFFCIRNREKIHRVGESVTVKFRNPKSSQDDRLVMEIDDGNVCEELVLEQDEYEKLSENSDYMIKNSEKRNCVRSYERDSQRIVDSIVGFFENLKLRRNFL